MARLGYWGAFALGIMLTALEGAASIAGEEPRRLVTGPVALEWNGSMSGPLRGFNGGDVTADVVMAPGTYYSKKHIGTVNYTDLILDVGTGMNQTVYDWIAEEWQGKPRVVDGAVVLSNYNYQVMARKEFKGGELREMTVPALDAGHKDLGAFSLTLRPEIVHQTKGAGTLSANVGPAAQKLWHTSNFRVTIDGLACSRIRKVDAFTVKLKPTIDFPNLRLTLPASDAGPWSAWLQSFVIAGKNDDTQEKTGEIAFLSADGSTELGLIHLYNLGIKALSYNDAGALTDQLKTVTVELYCERMAFDWKANPSAEIVKIRTLTR